MWPPEPLWILQPFFPLSCGVPQVSPNIWLWVSQQILSVAGQCSSDDNWAPIYEYSRISLGIIYWLFPQSYLVLSQFSRLPLLGFLTIQQYQVWTPSHGVFLRLDHCLATHTNSAPPLPQHILQAGHIAGRSFCGWVDIPVSLLVALPHY